MDSLDARILLALDRDPNATIVKLAKALSVARNTVQSRLRSLEERGILREFTKRVSLSELGYPIVAHISILTGQKHNQDTIDALCEIPEIVEMTASTGDADFRVGVVARDTKDLYRITQEIMNIPDVKKTKTAIQLKEIMSYRVGPLIERIANGAADDN